MKFCRNLAEFIKLNDKDLTNILLKKFKNLIKYYDIEDIKGDIYLRLLKKKYIENYRPLEIVIKKNKWIVYPTRAKFSTYICKFVYNYIFSYYNKIPQEHESLSDYKDNLYSYEGKKRLSLKQDSYNQDLSLDLEKIKNHLEVNKDRGTIICDDQLSFEIIKIIDRHNECSRTKLLLNLRNRQISFFNKKEPSGLELLLIDSILRNFEDKKYIKSYIRGDEVYYEVLNPQRRSLYELFNYYMVGMKDKEISEKFGITVAGVGALKKILRKEITSFDSF